MTNITSIKQALAGGIDGRLTAIDRLKSFGILEFDLHDADEILENISDLIASYEQLEAENAALKAERDRLREALKSARYYVEDAVIDDGGIDICEIQHRATLEKIDAALSTGQEEGNG